MNQIFNIIAPILILIGLGFVCVRYEWLKREHIQGMGVFVLKVALPLLIVNALMQKDFAEIWQTQYLIAYGIGSLVAAFTALWLYHIRLQEALPQAAIMAMGASMSNTGFIGYGVLSMLIGPQAAVYFSMNLLIENLLIIPLVLTLAEWGKQQNSTASMSKIALQTFKSVIKNPLVIGLVIGLLLSGFKISVGAPIERVLNLISMCASPIALLVIGGSLAGTSIQAAGKHALFISAIKLVLMPATVWLVFQFLPNVSAEMEMAGVLLASISMATVFSLFGQQYGIGPRSAAVLLLTTLMMFVSLSVVLILYPS
ncbi:putative transporter [Vitreoscilla sp. C1]|uniref:AEC family transporter n=1 Tax=Vitreoscilla sp. (strain C1) TaxID=96942 RepID=UPI000CDBFA9F|nr:AEC family transporter [Vitreoscilla sp. C1]AUZ04487.1 putative transporter [Vitreoscilla sp. C1]